MYFSIIRMWERYDGAKLNVASTAFTGRTLLASLAFSWASSPMWSCCVFVLRPKRTMANKGQSKLLPSLFHKSFLSRPNHLFLCRHLFCPCLAKRDASNPKMSEEMPSTKWITRNHLMQQVKLLHMVYIVLLFLKSTQQRRSLKSKMNQRHKEKKLVSSGHKKKN